MASEIFFQSFTDFFGVREKELFDHIWMCLVPYLLVVVLMPVLFVRIRQKHQSRMARSKEIAQIVAFNKIESYEAEDYCTICYSSPTRRCHSCQAVAYCNEKCRIDHWNQGHSHECASMADFRKCKMNHHVHYSKQQFKQFKDAGKSSNQQTSYSEHFSFNPVIINAFKQEKQTNPVNLTASKQEKRTNPVNLTATKQEKQTNPVNLTASKKEKSSREIPQFKSSTRFDECITDHSFANCDSFSDCRSSKCKGLIYCFEHHQAYEWENDHKIPQMVDDVGSTNEASKFDHFNISRAQRVSYKTASKHSSVSSNMMDDRRESKEEASARVVIGFRYPSFGRSSSSRSTYSSSASCSTGASDQSDAVSSVHGLDFD